MQAQLAVDRQAAQEGVEPPPQRPVRKTSSGARPTPEKKTTEPKKRTKKEERTKKEDPEEGSSKAKGKATDVRSHHHILHAIL